MVEGREERANVWASLIGPPGLGQVPRPALALAPLRVPDGAERRKFDGARRAWLATPVKDRQEADRPADGSFLHRDTTVEAIARQLHRRGVPSGWTSTSCARSSPAWASTSRGGGQRVAVRAGRGGRQPRPVPVLELWHGSPWSYTRVGGGGGENAIDLLIERPTLVLYGGVQDEYQHLLGAEGDGLRPRWLPHLATFAPPLPERSEAELTRAAAEATQARDAWAGRLRALLAVRARTRVWTLEPRAPAAVLRARAGVEAAGPLAGGERVHPAALRKADRQLLRLVLIVAELDDPGGVTGGLTVTAARLDAVVPLLEFCSSCWRALPTATALALTHQHAVLNEAVDRLAVWLEHHGGACTATGNPPGPRRRGPHPGALNLLLKRYLATFPGTIKTTEPGPQGGRPGRLVLAPKRLRGGGGGVCRHGDIPPDTPPNGPWGRGGGPRRGHGHSW